jgi:tRNA(Ile)-lysidine synthase
MAASPIPNSTLGKKPLVFDLSDLSKPLGTHAQHVLNALSGFEPELPLAVAYSGGADSMALLWACHTKWPSQVRAVHVHHGLQVAADEFVAHAKAFCDSMQIPFAWIKVNAKHAPGQSPEDAARIARYEALTEVLSKEWDHKVKSIALGQHADDQIETLVLALSRGAGLPGLSGMRPQWESAGVCFYRPLLSLSSKDLRACLSELGLTWIEDPSNLDESFTRNKIRARVVPSLLECFPEFGATLARSALHIAQAQGILDEVALGDLELVGNPPQIKKLQTLSVARQGNVLRSWLKLEGCTPSAAQLQELLSQLDACRTRGHRIHIKVGTKMIERQGDCLGLIQ